MNKHPALITVLALCACTATRLAADVTLQWDPPTTHADGSAVQDIAGYRIYYGTDSDPAANLLDGGLTTEATIGGLTPGITYHFAVTVYNSSGSESALSSAITWTGVADTDGDGIPDDWELTYFGCPISMNAEADSDGDGLSNYAEYIAGTDPTNAASVLAVTSMVRDSDGGVIVTWSSVSGRVYALQRTFRLGNPFETCTAEILATPPHNTYRDVLPAGSGDTVFYRIAITP